MTIESTVVLDNLKLGDSVAVSGPCLTVTDIGSQSFTVEATKHTIENSTINTWRIGRKLNLERALQVGDRLGGHIVQGHVDGVCKVSRLQFEAGATNIYIDIPPKVLSLIAPRGSVTVDGVSLTIADKTAKGFRLMVVPYTLEHTTLGELKPGETVNIETDLIIRWLADRFKDGEVTDDSTSWLAGVGSIHTED